MLAHGSSATEQVAVVSGDRVDRPLRPRLEGSRTAHIIRSKYFQRRARSATPLAAMEPGLTLPASPLGEGALGERRDLARVAAYAAR
jgi:hypothetical protein